MPSLSDHIDRLTQTARSIRTSASATSAFPNSGGPFTQAVLTTPLGDLIREVDPSELGLFTLVSPTPPNAPARETAPPSQPAEIARIEVASATPLRKHPAARREDTLFRPKEPEPEVYAEAAMKYLDRYASIRPMPRARAQVTAMLEHLQEIRENMRTLTENLKQNQTAEPVSRSQSPKSLLNDEELRIRDMQARIEQLQKRKVTLLQKRAVPRSRPPDPVPISSPLSNVDPQEDMFWNTPAAPARTLQFSNELLIDEQVDLGDVTTSFSSPIGPIRGAMGSRLVGEDEGDGSMDANGVEEDDETIGPQIVDESGDTVDEEGEDDPEDEEKTVMLKRLSPPSAPQTETTVDASVVEIEPAALPLPGGASTPPQSAKKQKVRITNEVERIVAKIWATVGDLIMPGHRFDTSGNGTNKPPRAKETIAHLHTLSAQTPAPLSPTASSLSAVAAPTPGAPTTQQILTAHMLLALLGAPPNFALPLNKLKEAISVGAGQVSTRVLYGCVAKRLVRIDRGGGEQVVRFDV
ncbi:hypothetical protein BV25DRAFT_1990653 [Artomyces pyxidatus]|uniref:Uncharacterized protein n=1 Tax=Artomyces pyxidatus TaxID=48021 RepID=A0ACB8T6X7_9AGAM|nr:hypothetical protein BV25DRAFT_1990653 [Artomyces pyxidatus]